MSISCWEGPTSWWVYSTWMPSCSSASDRLAAHVRARVERGQVEVAAAGRAPRWSGSRGTGSTRARGPTLKVSKPIACGPLERAPQHVARVALIGRALGRDDVAEHPPHALLLRAPRQHGEGRGSGIAIMSDSSIALKPVIEEPSKPMPASKRVVELGRVDRERLQLAEDVGEPEADEADVALGDDRLYVLRGLGMLLGHGSRPYSRAPGGPRIDVWPNAAALAGLSGRRRPPRSRRRLRLPCPGRAAPASARGRARGLRAIAFSTSALRPAGVRDVIADANVEVRTRCGRSDCDAASVWQTTQEWANSSRPLVCAAGEVDPARGFAGLVFAVVRQHQRGHQPARRRTARRLRAYAPGAARPSIRRVPAPRAARAGRRASPRRTRTGRGKPHQDDHRRSACAREHIGWPLRKPPPRPP